MPHVDHHEERGHAGGQVHAPVSFGRAFAIGIGLNAVFVAAEALYGWRAQSLALLADAGHNLSDVLGLVLAWGATVLARRPATERHTYGWQSSSVLAALANAIFLLASVGGIVWQAVRRLQEPRLIHAETVIWIAALGIVINTATALLFLTGRKDDLNIRGAFLHMAADAAVSAGVVVAGIVMAATSWFWVDPAVSLAVAAIITYGTWGLLRDSVNLALHAVPQQIDAGAVRKYLATLPGVAEVHHLHIWGLSTSRTALTVHLEMNDAAGHAELLRQINHHLHEQFGIEHTTIQMDAADSKTEGCGKFA